MILHRCLDITLQELGITEIYCSWRCVGGDPVAYYYQIIYYVVILVIFGIALVVALLSHSVKMKVLNDSRWIAAIVYVGVPIVILFFALTFVLAPWLHLSGAIYCIGLFVASSIFLGFIFIPKVRVHLLTVNSPSTLLTSHKKGTSVLHV